jgi:predicted helicase
METADEKLAWLGSVKAMNLDFEEVRPDAGGHWLHLSSNDFDELLPIASKDSKASTTPRGERAIFKLFSLGISTNRDEWVYALDEETLVARVKHLIGGYESHSPKHNFDETVKWSRNLKRRFEQGRREPFDAARFSRSAYRPFAPRHLYDSDLFIDEGGSKNAMFPAGSDNVAICYSDVGARTGYVVLAVDGIADLHFGSSIDAYQQVPLHRYDEAGTRIDTITDWALDQFKKHYQPGRAKKVQPVTKEAIFHYVYAVLHDPVYRETYGQTSNASFRAYRCMATPTTPSGAGPIGVRP